MPGGMATPSAPVETDGKGEVGFPCAPVRIAAVEGTSSSSTAWLFGSPFACIANTQGVECRDKVSAPQNSDGSYAQVLDTGMAMHIYIQRDDRGGKGHSSG